SSYGEALERGEIELRYDAGEASFAVWYFEHRLPIAPDRYGEIVQKAVAEAGAGAEPAGRELLAWAERYRGPHNPPRSMAAAFKAELAAIAGGREVIERGLKAYRPAPDRPDAVLSLHHLLERQHYRLPHLRPARGGLNHRPLFGLHTL